MVGISSIAEGMSILQQLAQSVAGEQPTERIDIRSTLATNAQTFQASMMTGVESFLGVVGDVLTPLAPVADVQVPSVTLTLETTPPMPGISVAPVVITITGTAKQRDLLGNTLQAAINRRKVKVSPVPGQLDMFAAPLPSTEPRAISTQSEQLSLF